MVFTKRKSTARQMENALKKVQTSTKVAPLKDTRPSVRLEEPLPSRISSSKPLPVLGRDRLPSHQLQSIAESGVLAASLERSRSRWLTDGLFERYWTKPIRRKGQLPEPLGNPPKDSMQRLGSCRMIIEPHVFDATLFMIHDLNSIAKPIPKPAPAQTSWSTFDVGHTPASTAQHQAPGKQLQHPMPISSRASPLPSKGTPPNQYRASNNLLQAKPSNSSQSPNANSPPQAHQKTGQDPVIQMLATRASSDSILKSLMQVVASGTADKDQLAAFQGHIDELSRLIRENAANEAALQPPAVPTSMVQNASAKVPQGAQTGNFASSATNTFKSQPPLFSANPSYSSPSPFSQQVKLAPSAIPKPGLVGIAIEFATGNGDRLLFPRNSIMQYNGSPREVSVSFLVTRKGNEVEGSRLHATQDYFQPVTIRISSDSPRVLETISKAIATPEEAKTHMEGAMSNAQPAEDTQLALQLPRAGERSDLDSTPGTPVGGRAKSSSMFAGIMSSNQSKQSKEEQNSFEENHCMYCFDEVSKPPQKLEQKTVCTACVTLRKKELQSMARPVSHIGVSKGLAAGPMALMF